MSKLFEYAVLSNLNDAETLINEICGVKGFSNWAEPIKHPTKESFLVRIDWSQLGGCEGLFEDLSIISRSEAKKRGWYFGLFKGTFGREREKLEDIHFIFDALVSFHGNPNFPALRALTLSFLSACYALKESMKNMCESEEYKGELGSWWKKRSKEMEAKGQLLKAFERFMNTEKHGGSIAHQHSLLDIVPHALVNNLVVTSVPVGASIKTLQLSAQGAFVYMFVGTPLERRVPVGIQDALYEIVVENPPQKHLGYSIEGTSFLQMIKLIRNYYAQLIFDAEVIIGERTSRKSSIEFSAEQNLSTSSQ
jgi:hypothetical protein